MYMYTARPSSLSWGRFAGGNENDEKTYVGGRWAEPSARCFKSLALTFSINICYTVQKGRARGVCSRSARRGHVGHQTGEFGFSCPFPGLRGFGGAPIQVSLSLSFFFLERAITVTVSRLNRGDVCTYMCVCIYMRFTSHARYSTLYSTPDRCRLDRNAPIGNSQSCFLSSSSSYHLNTTERICS